uniref:Uncharacterized protein n=1 Tax=Arundo donax TaxID=35708 RepID=A0A0A9TZ27_ARUDO
MPAEAKAGVLADGVAAAWRRRPQTACPCRGGRVRQQGAAVGCFGGRRQRAGG